MASHYIIEKRHNETQHSTPVLSSICYTSSVCRKNASTCPAWASEIHSSGRSGYYCVTRHESNRKSEEQPRPPSTDRAQGSTGCDPGQVEGRNGKKGDHRKSITKYEISFQRTTASDMNRGSLAPPHHHHSDVIIHDQPQYQTQDKDANVVAEISHREAYQTICPKCEKQILTDIQFSNGDCVAFTVLGLLVTCPFFIWLPIVLACTRDVMHTCPSCGYCLGRYTRLRHAASCCV